MKTQFRYLAAFALSAVFGCATVTDRQAKTPEAAIGAFMREYIGVQFGDDISKVNGYEDGQYEIPMLKDFLHFNRVACFYQKGKLCRINMWVDVGNKYSQASTEAQIKKALTNLAKCLCLPVSYFDKPCMHLDCPAWGQQVKTTKLSDKQGDAEGLSYSVKYVTVKLANYRRYVIDIVDSKLDASLKSPTVKAPAYKPVTEEMRRNWGIPLPDAE